jgi:excisionase family DNA binding protein
MIVECRNASLWRSVVPDSGTQSGRAPSEGEVLTLAETAAYLRVPEEAVLDLVASQTIPGQKIGGEWRFLKRALTDWLRFGPRFFEEFRRFPLPWMLDHPFWEDFFHALERRILSRLPAPEQPSAKPGSKHAVLKHFGVFRDDDDLEDRLADARARREADG